MSPYVGSKRPNSEWNTAYMNNEKGLVPFRSRLYNYSLSEIKKKIGEKNKGKRTLNEFVRGY